MKTYEVLSETSDGTLVAVVSTEAKDAVDAMRQTANFCDMMDIEVHSIVSRSDTEDPQGSVVEVK